MSNAQLPESNFFEFNLNKIEAVVGYEHEHDVRSVVETADAMWRGETEVAPRGLNMARRHTARRNTPTDHFLCLILVDAKTTVSVRCQLLLCPSLLITNLYCGLAALLSRYIMPD